MDNILYNILYSLNDKLDKNDVGSINFTLAQYFIKNLREIPEANIYSVAEECNVSRASIRRFAKSMGFDNFAHMKSMVKDHLSEVEVIPDKNYRELLTGDLIRIVNELDDRMNTHEIDVICKRIKDSKKMYIFTSRTGMSNARDFQIQLASRGKLSYIITDNLKMLNDIAVKDYVMVLSVSGMFAESIEKYMSKVNCTKDLITVNRIHDFEKTYSNTYYMSHLDHSKNPDIYRAYGLHYFLDIIQNHYK
ncbi:MurR/RpiR family transcriptional regulator [Companilactobacillus musae]|uniref:MurR/RpiR family transcriptional regulator n=1 Tax=Companilactobacillus musae TaxID=1903258 RepID=UPI000E64C50E|nr:MurR/RpiR family transcriptional regulator [Companilactobacillus musae]